MFEIESISHVFKYCISVDEVGSISSQISMKSCQTGMSLTSKFSFARFTADRTVSYCPSVKSLKVVSAEIKQETEAAKQAPEAPRDCPAYSVNSAHVT